MMISLLWMIKFSKFSKKNKKKNFLISFSVKLNFVLFSSEKNKLMNNQLTVEEQNPLNLTEGKKS